MGYTIGTKYCWFKRLFDTNDRIVLMYFIENVPFTFEELPDFASHDSELIELANCSPKYNLDDMYHSSTYLILEHCHPLIFELELENPELLPID